MPISPNAPGSLAMTTSSQWWSGPRRAPSSASTRCSPEMSRLRGRAEANLWRLAAECWIGLDERLERLYADWRQAGALLLAGESRAEADELLARAAGDAREIGAATLAGEIGAPAGRPPSRGA